MNSYLTDSAGNQRQPQRTDDGACEAPVMEFFDHHAKYYERSWDTREHGLHIGIFEGLDETAGDLESAYERSRDHVMDLLGRSRALGEPSRVLDVCCGTGATLAQIVRRHDCAGVGVDLSAAQLELAARFRHTDMDRGNLLFRQGSASKIADVVRDQAPFTHAFSQEGLLFAHDKRAALRGIFDVLEDAGALVISDFVPLVSKDELDAALRARVYDDVNWGEGLSFDEYLDVLEETGFRLVQAELRPLDMRITYQKLTARTEAMASDDTTYAFLAKRYAGIVRAVDNGALSWAWFGARKP